ncbi:hypothetical protein AN958_11084 [Leucoagaricus sp. SymC.cos]|nr:hypothetical protein AN958_11084 [Leucoagaricus sp. SymC.cos]
MIFLVLPIRVLRPKSRFIRAVPYCHDWERPQVKICATFNASVVKGQCDDGAKLNFTIVIEGYNCSWDSRSEQEISSLRFPASSFLYSC